MKYGYALGLLLLAHQLQAQTTHLISVYGDYFEPDTLDILAGDSIHLVFVDEFHTFTQVDDTTWFADGTTWNGGFEYGYATPNPGVDFTFSVDLPGIYYYVCIYHLGMKGIINVSVNDGLSGVAETDGPRFYPNPASDQLTIQLQEAADVVLTLTDMQGRAVGAPHRSVGAISTLDLSSLSAGIFRIIIEADGKRQVLPLVKQ